jgi:hypothetical protein
LKKCKENGLVKPVWTSYEKTGVTLTFSTPEVTQGVAPEVALQVTPEVLQILGTFLGDMPRRDLQRLLGLKTPSSFSPRFCNEIKLL